MLAGREIVESPSTMPQARSFRWAAVDKCSGAQMRVPTHHLVRLPAAQLHRLLQARATYDVPARPRVPHIVESKRFDPGTPQSTAPPRRAHRPHPSALVRKAPTEGRPLGPLEGRARYHCSDEHGIIVQRNAASLAVLRGPRIQPRHAPTKINAAPLKCRISDICGHGDPGANATSPSSSACP